MEKNCKICGKKFIAKCNHQIYCDSCRLKHERKHKYRGDNQKNRIKNAAKQYQSRKYRDLIFAYGCQCALCGWTMTNYGKLESNIIDDILPLDNEFYIKTKLDVHHIKEVCNGGTDDYDNLIPLCPNCHKLVHEGLMPDYKKLVMDEKTVKEKSSLFRSLLQSSISSNTEKLLFGGKTKSLLTMLYEIQDNEFNFRNLYKNKMI